MTESEVFDTVKRILTENFAIPEDKVTPEARFRKTFGMDSLDIVDLIFMLGQTFGVTDEVDDYRELHDVGKLVTFIARRTEELEESR